MQLRCIHSTIATQLHNFYNILCVVVVNTHTELDGMRPRVHGRVDQLHDSKEIAGGGDVEDLALGGRGVFGVPGVERLGRIHSGAK